MITTEMGSLVPNCDYTFKVRARPRRGKLWSDNKTITLRMPIDGQYNILVWLRDTPLFSTGGVEMIFQREGTPT